MPLTDVDEDRRRTSDGLPTNCVDFILYSYNEYLFEEKTFQSVNELVNLLKNEIEDEEKPKDKYHWIEVINRSCVNLPENIKILCEHFHIHPLTIEDITTLTPYMKLDLFSNDGALYLLMKILTWNGQRVQQQQISFYLKCSQNLLITFQEQSFDNIQPFFQKIRHRLRRQQFNNDEQSQQYQNTRLRQLNVDYLFYCLLDDIIDRHMFVMEEISIRIGQFDVSLMRDPQSRTLNTLHSIYRLKHDLLHLRILFNPLKEIISRLQRTTSDDQHVSYPRTDPSLRLGMKHHILRRQAKTVRRINKNRINKLTSIYLNDYIYVYLNDLNNHIDQLIDSLEILRESVSSLVSFWVTLNSNETEQILQILMLICVLFMPCTLLTGMNSTNFLIQPQYQYYYGYYIILSLLAFLLGGMILWYKIKKWL
jgi:magnesium transporter